MSELRTISSPMPASILSIDCPLDTVIYKVKNTKYKILFINKFLFFSLLKHFDTAHPLTALNNLSFSC